MTVSAASSAIASGLSQQLQSLTQHKRSRHPSISDVDMQSSNAANTPSTGGKAGNKVDITA
jgi:hypothetical protein